MILLWMDVTDKSTFSCVLEDNTVKTKRVTKMHTSTVASASAVPMAKATKVAMIA